MSMCKDTINTIKREGGILSEDYDIHCQLAKKKIEVILQSFVIAF